MNNIESRQFVLYIFLTALTFFILLTTVVIFIYLSRKKVLEQRLRNKELQLKMQKEILKAVVDTQEQERLRIARDLHDDISSKLNAVSMNVHILKRKNLVENVREEIADSTLEACHLLIDSARQITHNLIPPSIENGGLDVVIKEVCDNISEAEMTKIRYENEKGQSFFRDFSLEQQLHLFRIMQELITNSTRHGKATEIELSFTLSGASKMMTYCDNGTGMEKEGVSPGKGIGMKNILFRSDMLNAVPYYEIKKKGFHFTLKFNENEQQN